MVLTATTAVYLAMGASAAWAKPRWFGVTVGAEF
jgi:hypothetical protein